MSNTYRAYLIDARNRIARAEVLDVSTDDAALEAAAAFTAENDVEVWHGERRLARIVRRSDASSAAPPPDAAKPESRT